MAEVTGFTADRMRIIENETVVDGEVRGDDLILVTREGTEINTGNVRGPVGPVGPPVSDGAKGDITVSGTGTDWQINPDSVSNAELADMPANRIKGAIAAGNPVDLTPQETATMLPAPTVGNKGIVPPLPAVNTGAAFGYFAADGQWKSAPPIFSTKADLDSLWVNAPNGSLAYVHENYGVVYRRYGTSWVMELGISFGRGSFSSPTMGGNAGMTLWSSVLNFSTQDSWGVRPLIPGVYKFTANAIHSGGVTGGSQVWQVEVHKYTWANANVAAEAATLFTGNPLFWGGISVSGVFPMALGDWFRIYVSGDAGGAMDGRSNWNAHRVGPNLVS